MPYPPFPKWKPWTFDTRESIFALYKNHKYISVYFKHCVQFTHSTDIWSITSIVDWKIWEATYVFDQFPELFLFIKENVLNSLYSLWSISSIVFLHYLQTCAPLNPLLLFICFCLPTDANRLLFFTKHICCDNSNIVQRPQS